MKDKHHKEQELVPLDQLKRALADYQNLKKEMLAKQQEWIKYGLTDFLERFLPLYNHLETAINHIPDTNQAWVQGLLAAVRQLDQLLAEAGARPINEANVPFDHQYHDAVAATTEGEAEAGKVTKVLIPGWQLNDKVIIPAKVEVKT